MNFKYGSLTQEQLEDIRLGVQPEGMSYDQFFNCRKKMRESGIPIVKKEYKSKLDKLDPEVLNEIKDGNRPQGMSPREYSKIRCLLRKRGLVTLEKKNGFYSEDQIRVMMLGVRPAGVKRATFQAWLKNQRKHGVVIKAVNHIFNHEWTPSEDLLVVDGDVEEYPKDIPIERCEQRRTFLQEEFVQTGWAAMIGSRKIYNPKQFSEREGA